MDRVFERLRRFLAELKRRKVYRVAIAYAAAAFVGLEALDLLVPATRLPGWAPSLFVALAVLGFPVALVLAWAFEVGPEGVKRTERARVEGGPGAEEATGGRRAALPPAGRVAGILLLLLAGAAAWYIVRPRSETGPDPSGRRLVAVLPFTTSGAAVEDLGEGMVNLLSTALDGAGGVRAIDQRTVLARWDRATAAGGEPDLETALEVARRLGAEWAVTGSVVSVGEDARFVARVVRPADGERVGEVQVEGARDSLLSTIDALTREVLGVLFERAGEDVARVPMASLTTRSVPALKAFLTGERHYRQGRVDSALAGYVRAVETDSTFALAHFRRAVAYAWVHGTRYHEASLEQAYRHRERLSDRARLAVVGVHLLTRSDTRAADTLEYATDRYPDDAALWSWLGHAYFFKLVCRGPEIADSVLSRAVELDPGFAFYRIIPIQLAIGFRRDSAMAARRIEALGRNIEGATGFERYVRVRPAPGEPVDANQDPWIRLVFGQGSAAERVDALLDAAERGDVNVEASMVNLATGHPSLWALRDTLLRRALSREVPRLSGSVPGMLVENSLRAGRIRRALEDLRRLEIDDRAALYYLVKHRSIGVPVPDSVIRRRLEALEDTEVRGFFDLISRSIAAVELEAPELAPPVERVLTRLAREAGADSARTERVRRAIQGYRAWKAGDEETAIELLERGVPAWLPQRLWLSDLHRSTDRLEEAARCYRTEWEEPVAYRRLGDTYAAMGRDDEAVEAYRTFLDVWQGSEDPEVQAEVEAVLERVIELSEPLESAESATGG